MSRAGLIRVVWATSLVPGIIVCGSISSAFSQNPYIPPLTCELDPRFPLASQKACEQVMDSLNQFSEEGEELGTKAGEIVEEVSTRTVDWPDGEGGRVRHERIARENPLDENNGNQGGKAWEEYAHDSKLALGDDFIGCLEPREVVGHPEYNPICREICPRFVRVLPGCPACNPAAPDTGGPPCVEQEHIVLEYYLPIYEIATNKAGARSLNVNMFNGLDNAPELTRSSTQDHQENKDKPGVEQKLSQLGIPVDELEWPPWHTPGEEPYLQGNNESFDVTDAAQSFPIAYQTNVHAQGTRDRPPQFWEGFLENDRSGLWCFNDPGKKVVSNSMDGGNGLYSLMARVSELTQVAWPEAYQATVNMPFNLQSVGQREELPDGIEPNFRMQKWPNPYSDLRVLDVRPGGGGQSRDWIFYGGTLAPFNVSRFNSFTDPVRADMFRAATAALLFGADRASLLAENTYRKRLPWFTKYRFREGKQGYTGNTAGVKEPIIFTDKLQLAFPPIKDGNPRTGTACLRIENLPNNEPGGRSGETASGTTSGGHTKIPKDLRKQFLEKGFEELNRANETRVLLWDKRVLCACERCGRPFGCTTLNNGDFEEDIFVGNGRAFTTPPPPFRQLMPSLKRYAEKQSPPKQFPPVLDPINIPGLIDDGRPGPLQGPNPAPPRPDVPNPPIFIFCLPEILQAIFSRDGSIVPTASVARRTVGDEVDIDVFEYRALEGKANAASFLGLPAGKAEQCSKNGCKKYPALEQRKSRARMTPGQLREAKACHLTGSDVGVRCTSPQGPRANRIRARTWNASSSAARSSLSVRSARDYYSYGAVPNVSPEVAAALGQSNLFNSGAGILDFTGPLQYNLSNISTAIRNEIVPRLSDPIAQKYFKDVAERFDSIAAQLQQLMQDLTNANLNTNFTNVTVNKLIDQVNEMDRLIHEIESKYPGLLDDQTLQDFQDLKDQLQAAIDAAKEQQGENQQQEDYGNAGGAPQEDQGQVCVTAGLGSLAQAISSLVSRRDQIAVGSKQRNAAPWKGNLSKATKTNNPPESAGSVERRREAGPNDLNMQWETSSRGRITRGSFSDARESGSGAKVSEPARDSVTDIEKLSVPSSVQTNAVRGAENQSVPSRIKDRRGPVPQRQKFGARDSDMQWAPGSRCETRRSPFNAARQSGAGNRESEPAPENMKDAQKQSVPSSAVLDAEPSAERTTESSGSSQWRPKTGVTKLNMQWAPSAHREEERDSLQGARKSVGGDKGSDHAQENKLNAQKQSAPSSAVLDAAPSANEERFPARQPSPGYENRFDGTGTPAPGHRKRANENSYRF